MKLKSKEVAAIRSYLSKIGDTFDSNSPQFVEVKVMELVNQILDILDKKDETRDSDNFE